MADAIASQTDYKQSTLAENNDFLTEKSAVSSPNTDFSREVKRISESKYTELGEEDINVY